MATCDDAVSDNLFDRLFELFQSPGPVNWKLAHEVVGSVAGGREAIEPRLADEYQELGVAAELRAANTPGISVVMGGNLHPVDRATWAEENEQSFRFLFEPLADRLSTMKGAEGPMAAMLQPLGPALLGMQAGTLIGLMSHDALGQFDTGLPALDHDRRYLIVPNVEGFATSHGLDARQVRMWAATREIVHHAIVGVDWLRSHVVTLVRDYFADIDFDLSGLMERLGAIEDPSRIQELIGNTEGLPALLGGEPDPVKRDAIAALLVFVDGYGHWAARKALIDVVPAIDEIERVAAARRDEPSQVDQALTQLAGISVDRAMSGNAAEFIAEIESRWGLENVARLWESPDALPTLSELTDPVGWAARMLL